MNGTVCDPRANPVFEADSFFANPWSTLFFNPESHTSGPRINVAESTEGFVLQAEVPGWKQDEIDVEVHDGVLTLRGKQGMIENTKAKEPESDYQIREFIRRNFERSFRLGEQVDTETISAKLENGILTIGLRKKEEVRPKRVKISVDA